jgi:hypothetical protein
MERKRIRSLNLKLRPANIHRKIRNKQAIHIYNYLHL